MRRHIDVRLTELDGRRRAVVTTRNANGADLVSHWDGPVGEIVGTTNDEEVFRIDERGVRAEIARPFRFGMTFDGNWLAGFYRADTYKEEWQ